MTDCSSADVPGMEIGERPTLLFDAGVNKGVRDAGVSGYSGDKERRGGDDFFLRDMSFFMMTCVSTRDNIFLGQCNKTMFLEWTHPIVVDSIWTTLLHNEWLQRHNDMRFKGPTHMWHCISNAFSSLRAMHPISDLYRRIDRPFLSDIQDPLERSLLVRTDFAVRTFLQDVQHLSRLLQIQIRCSGEYAAWRFERRMDTCAGGDAFPRTLRSTSVGRSEHTAPVWIPHEIELFTTSGNEDSVLLVVQEAYVRMLQNVYGAFALHMCAFVPGGKMNEFAQWESSTTLDGHDPDVSDADVRVLNDVLRTTSLAQMFISDATHSYDTSKEVHLKRRKLWTLSCSLRTHVEPLTVVVWHVDSLDAPSGHSFCHEGITMHVRANGDLRWEGSRQAFVGVTSRSLRFRCTPPPVQAAREICRYAACGFTFREPTFEHEDRFDAASIKDVRVWAGLFPVGPRLQVITA